MIAILKVGWKHRVPRDLRSFFILGRALKCVQKRVQLGNLIEQHSWIYEQWSRRTACYFQEWIAVFFPTAYVLLCQSLPFSGRLRKTLGIKTAGRSQHGPGSGLLGQRMSAWSCLPPVVIHWPEVISRFLRRQNLQAEAGIVEVTWIMPRETHENPWKSTIQRKITWFYMIQILYYITIYIYILLLHIIYMILIYYSFCRSVNIALITPVKHKGNINNAEAKKHVWGFGGPLIFQQPIA